MEKSEFKRVITTRKVVLAFCLGIIILVFSQVISALPGQLPLPKSVATIVYGGLYVFISYRLLKVVCTKIVPISLEECRIGKPYISKIWFLVAIFLPAIVSAVLLCMPGEFVRNDLSHLDIFNIVMSALFVVGFGAGVVEEMIFRGFIMAVLERRWGKRIAIVIPSVLFGLLHASGGMHLLDVLILLVAGTSVGIMFSLIVYESGSIWCSALVHGIWNMIMIGGILNIGMSHNENAIYSYDLFSESILLTGGEFGVEASIVAIIGYAMVIILALYVMKRKSC
ncbi:MAG: lysostaphin resistance A-like protein [Bacillus sp. (in: firmicutes)]